MWVATLVLASIIVITLPRFFAFLNERLGRVLQDPLLQFIPARDVSLLLFPVLYITILVVVLRLWRDGDRLLRAAQAYVILLILRMVSMTLLTLEPPPDLIPLVDPITQIFYPSAEPFAKDLFFSGHTATVFLLYLAVPARTWRTYLMMITVFVASAVLVQHVHWTIDVLAAPFAAWLAWLMSGITYRWSTGRRVSDAEVS